MTWQVRIDRRKIDRSLLLTHLTELCAGVEGITLHVHNSETFDHAPDLGTFRDFIAVGNITHIQEAPLEYIAEELLEIFGWGVDMKVI